MLKLLPKRYRKGFSYIEVLVAMLLFSSAFLALAHSGLNQVSLTRVLTSQLASQHLLLTIQNRLLLNSEYIKEWQERSVYFKDRATETNLDCSHGQLASCNNKVCTGEELALLDLFELSCLAKEIGAGYQLVLDSYDGINNLIRLQLLIWQASSICEPSQCKRPRYEFLL